MLVSLWVGVASHQLVGFFSGGLVGSLATAWSLLRDDVPSYLQSWHRGEEGERRTRQVLAELGWQFVEDVDCGRGNYDHLLAGPPGVFMLETKNLTGIVEIREGTPWLRRRHDPEGEKCLADIAKQALRNSAIVHNEIERRGAGWHWVKAIVVFWSEFPQGVVEGDKIVYLHGSKLRDWIMSKAHKLDPADIATVAGALASLKAEGEIRAQQRHSEGSVATSQSVLSP